MHCDHIFDALTLPGGRGRPEVATHLAGCPRCRDLAEALALFDAPTEVADGLAAWSPDSLSDGAASAAESTELARRTAERLGLAAIAPSAPMRQRSGLRYIAAFLAGAAASLGIAAMLSSAPAGSILPSQNACLWLAKAETESESNEVVLSCVACHLAAAPR